MKQSVRYLIALLMSITLASCEFDKTPSKENEMAFFFSCAALIVLSLIAFFIISYLRERAYLRHEHELNQRLTQYEKKHQDAGGDSI